MCGGDDSVTGVKGGGGGGINVLISITLSVSGGGVPTKF